MQLILSALLFAFPFFSLTAASGICTSSDSLPWPPVGDCSLTSKFDTLVKTCRACCMNDADCFQVCLKAGGISKRETSGKKSLGIVPDRIKLKVRADTLSCDVNEGCYKFTDRSLLCLNLGTGLYHDDVGGNGSYYSGVYTGPDGKVQTVTSTATATSGGKPSSATSQMTVSSTSVRTTSAPAQTTSAAAASASTSSAAAHAVLLAGSDVLYLGANVGLVGLVAGFAL